MRRRISIAAAVTAAPAASGAAARRGHGPRGRGHGPRGRGRRGPAASVAPHAALITASVIAAFAVAWTRHARAWP